MFSFASAISVRRFAEADALPANTAAVSGASCVLPRLTSYRLAAEATLLLCFFSNFTSSSYNIPLRIFLSSYDNRYHRDLLSQDSEKRLRVSTCSLHCVARRSRS